MRVACYIINRNQPGQYFGLKSAEPADGVQVMRAPTFRTEKGAERWAVRHGFEYIAPSR